MTQQAFERGDWPSVIEAHPLESHDPAEWLRYGVALLQTITPGPDAGKQQQQAALAFLQAQKEGASAESVAAAQRQSLFLSIGAAMLMAGMKPSPQIARQTELAVARAQIQILLTEKMWLQAIAELERLPEHLCAESSLRNQIRAAVLSAFAGTGPEQAPADYAVVNQLREEQGVALIEQWKDGMEVMARLENATPLVLINGFVSARKRLEEQPFWIAYGNVRSGSTMVFNLLRILANSLSSSAISAWEGDLVSPEKFFHLVDESAGVNLGVLKIHRPHDAVNARLASGQARAILSCRDMATACFSYWRMLHNAKSPFFNDEAELTFLDRFVESEITNFQLKSAQRNILIVREDDLRFSTLEAIRRIASFMNMEVADQSLTYLSDFLGAKRMRQLAEDNHMSTNTTGHERVTFLHPGHIAQSSSDKECSSEVREYIDELIRKNQVALDTDGYCRLVDVTE